MLAASAALMLTRIAAAQKPPTPISEESRDDRSGAGSRTPDDRGEEPAPDPEYASTTFRPRDEGSRLLSDLLKLPELGLRLAFTPLFPLLALAEETRLDHRIEDLVTNDAHSRFVLPVFVALTRDGVGGGILYRHTDLFGSGEHLTLFGLMKVNGDRSVRLGYSEMVAVLNGRRLGMSLDHGVDHNERFFGIGPDAPQADLRALEARTLGATLKLDVGGPSTFFSTGLGSEVSLHYTRERLESGHHPGVEPLGQAGDSVEPPAGFEQTLDYAAATLRSSYDQRDMTGRTHRGFFSELRVNMTSDMNSQNVNAVRTDLSFAYFLPVAPRHRVLVLHAGSAIAAPLGEQAEIPLDSLVSLGRNSGLRGYTDRRFRDRSGYWATLEYRYPVFDFEDTENGLSAALFVDAGGVSRSPLDYFHDPLHLGPGFGLRAELPGLLVLTGHVAISSEGIEASLGVNERYELGD